MNKEDKLKVLDTTIALIEREQGKGSIIMLGDSPIVQVPVISTGSLALDLALGTGGMPRGRIIEAYGPEASGKTTLGLHMVAEAQKLGGIAAYVDLEHSLDLQYAQNIGVNVGELVFTQPNSGDEGLDTIDKLTKSGAIDIIVVDSVSAIVPKEELEGHITDSHVGRQARLMSQAMRILAGRANRTGTMIYFINQLRMKIGVMFGNPETTSGGNALKFYSSVRLDIRRKAPIKDDSEFVGANTKVKVVKNKLAAPFKIADMDIIYGEGIDRMGDIINLGPKLGIVQQSGAWFSYEGERLGQGKENTKAFLREHPELAEEIFSRIIRKALPHRYAEDDPEVEVPEEAVADAD
jgi:recombination protein RecA